MFSILENPNNNNNDNNNNDKNNNDDNNDVLIFRRDQGCKISFTIS